MNFPFKSDVAPSAELSYLDELMDFESGVDRGPLSGKEYLIYAPGKTGTVSIYESIIEQLAKDIGYSSAVNKMLHNHNNTSIVSVIKNSSNLSKREILDKCIVRDLIELKKERGERLNIITSFRDPLKRAISGTFQQLDTLVSRGDVSIPEISYDDMYQRLMSNLQDFLVSKHPLEEFHDGFFDVYSFDHQLGNCCVRFKEFNVLVLCLEKSDSWENSLRDFTGFSNLTLRKSNAVSQKVVASLHDQFVDQLRMSRDQIADIYYGDKPQHRQLSWFYTKSEIEEMFKKSVLRFGNAK